MVTHQPSSEDVPAPSQIAPEVYRLFHRSIQAGLVKSAHDLSEGGLAVAAAEMCIGGRLGLHLDLSSNPHQTTRTLFGETNGCLLAEVAPEDAAAFEKTFENNPILRVGTATSDPVLVMCTHNETQLSLPVADLVTAWNPAPFFFKRGLRTDHETQSPDPASPRQQP
jgi:phosphoribosylformylglycinamidine synthase